MSKGRAAPEVHHVKRASEVIAGIVERMHGKPGLFEIGVEHQTNCPAFESGDLDECTCSTIGISLYSRDEVQP